MSRTVRAGASAWLVAVVVVALTGCGESPPRPDGLRCKQCNVVLVVVDTLRADHVGSYGYSRPTTPALDDFANSAVRFSNAHSQASCTFPSVNSLLTGRPVFPFLDPQTRPAIPVGVPTLAEVLRRQGYRTGAVSASPIVRKTPGRFNEAGGFGNGFDEFNEECTWNTARCVNRRVPALLDRWLGDGDAAPFFLYLHYMDPHDPYRPEAPIRGMFSEPYDGPNAFVAQGDPNPLATRIREAREPGPGLPASEPEVLPADLAHLIDLYDEMIVGWDRGFRGLLTMFESRGLREDTIVIVTSDHGEAFYEHGYVKHCYTVFENESRVPMLIRVPGLDQARTVSSAVSNIDLVPTILDLVEHQVPGLSLAGDSLRALIERGVEDPSRVSFSAMGPHRSISGPRFKLVFDLRETSYRLFDLVEDPGETEDVLRRERRHFRSLYERLMRWSQTMEPGDPQEHLEQTEAIERELRALGYLG